MALPPNVIAALNIANPPNINLNGQSYRDFMLGALDLLYYGSPLMGTMLDYLVLQNKTLTIQYAPGQIAALYNPPTVIFDPLELPKSMYFNTSGVAYNPSLYVTLAHELSHAIYDADDPVYLSQTIAQIEAVISDPAKSLYGQAATPAPSPPPPWTSGAVQLENAVSAQLAAQLGVANFRAGYFNTISTAKLTLEHSTAPAGVSWSEGQQIDAVITTRSVNNVDISARSINSLIKCGNISDSYPFSTSR